MNLSAVIGHGIEIGDGLACKSSPFSDFIVTEFYDGAVEGFARVIGGRAIAHFKKVWWDQWQDSRLFHLVLLDEKALRAEAPELLDFFDRRSKITNWSQSLSTEENEEAAALADVISRSKSAVRLHIFCRDISGAGFILPASDD